MLCHRISLLHSPMQSLMHRFLNRWLLNLIHWLHSRWVPSRTHPQHSRLHTIHGVRRWLHNSKHRRHHRWLHNSMLQPKSPSEILILQSPHQGVINWVFQDQAIGILRYVNMPYMDCTDQQSASPSAPQPATTSALAMT